MCYSIIHIMPKNKKPKLKKFVKPKFVPKPPEVITLSDSEDLIEVVEKSVVIDISESSSSDEENSSPDVVTIDDDDDCDVDRRSCNRNCKGFCSHGKALDYIPIQTVPFSFIRNQPKSRKRKKGKEVAPVFVKNTPIIKLSQPNTFNIDVTISELSLRPVIIDGSNVAYGFGNGEFKIKGVIVVIQFFLARGHEEIVCFLPAHYRHRERTPSENAILQAYERDQIITYTPSRRINKKTIVPYDDRYIVQYATEKGGVIISNDGYADLIGEDPLWEETITKRVINYTFARGLFMLPKDPLGRDGPTLDEILRFS